MQLAIEAQQVARRFGHGETAVQALVAVDFQVESGEFVAIMGPSGSGKSTLLSILGGLDTVDDGNVLVGGHTLRGMTESDLAALRRDKIGFVFQTFNLIPVLSGAENVALPLILAGHSRRSVEERTTRMLSVVGLQDRSGHLPAELSGGQQQRIAVARALVTEPAILLADEPTGNLDSKNSRELMRILRHAKDAMGQTVVLITHDPAIAMWADRVVFMRDGRIAGELRKPGSVAEILQRYEELTAGGDSK